MKNHIVVEDLFAMLCTMFYFCFAIVTQVHSVVMSLSSYAWEFDGHSQLEIFSAWGLFQLIF